MRKTLIVILVIYKMSNDNLVSSQREDYYDYKVIIFKILDRILTVKTRQTAPPAAACHQEIAPRDVL